MPINDFLPFAIGTGANVLPQAEYDALTARGTGFTAGTAKSLELNKVWRQSAFVASAISQLIADSTGSDVLDDGNSSVFQGLFAQAIAQLSKGNNYAVDTGTANAYLADYTPNITALTDGMVLLFRASTTNTGASTFDADGLGAKPIVMPDGAPMSAGAIAAGGEVWVQYNSSLGGGSWVSVLSSAVLPATTTQAGVIRVATALEVSEGVATDIAVDPAGISGVYAKKATTLVGYGITDAYTKGEVYAKTETYNKTEVDGLVSGKQDSLGFTPVQQGGGAGQLTSKVYLGWSGSDLLAQVDALNLGRLWSDNNVASLLPIQLAALNAGVVGSYGLFYSTAAASVAPGGILNGADLIWSDTSENDGGVIGYGSWRAMGNGSSTNATIYLRIA